MREKVTVRAWRRMQSIVRGKKYSGHPWELRAGLRGIAKPNEVILCRRGWLLLGFLVIGNLPGFFRLSGKR
ncbi:MAG: hypothetical protein ACE5JO_14155 [Candidatus Binatia bacterium]